MTECERTALYLDGELPADEEAAVLSHMATCASCQAELGDWVGFETAMSRTRAQRPIAGGSDARLVAPPAPKHHWLPPQSQSGELHQAPPT